jgi:hypothetical protein
LPTRPKSPCPSQNRPKSPSPSLSWSRPPTPSKSKSRSTSHCPAESKSRSRSASKPRSASRLTSPKATIAPPPLTTSPSDLAIIRLARDAVMGGPKDLTMEFSGTEKIDPTAGWKIKVRRTRPDWQLWWILWSCACPWNGISPSVAEIPMMIGNGKQSRELVHGGEWNQRRRLRCSDWGMTVQNVSVLRLVGYGQLALGASALMRRLHCRNQAKAEGIKLKSAVAGGVIESAWVPSVPRRWACPGRRWNRCVTRSPGTPAPHQPLVESKSNTW